jgi:predicted nucleic acid-binding protein
LGGQAVKITADTNVLVRALTGDDARQSKAAQAELASADLVALTVPALCELVSVLSKGYRVRSAEIAEALRLLMNGANVVGSPGRTRTSDPAVNSRLLYQLSYRGSLHRSPTAAVTSPASA